MATNSYVSLAVPAGNGSGASSNVSALSSLKTIQVAGTFTGVLQIEVSNDAGTTWLPVITIIGPGKYKVNVAVGHMRVTRQGVDSLAPGSAVVNVGAEITTLLQTANLNVPAVNSAGAATDITDFGSLNTISVSTSSFQGALIIEVSEDAGTTWTPCMTLGGAGVYTRVFTGEQIRVRRSGIDPTGPAGTPVVTLGALPSESEGSSGGGGTSQDFVYQPGGTSGGNVYTDWATLMTAAAGVGGPKQIFFDDTYAACIIPVGSWDMADVTWRGRNGYTDFISPATTYGIPQVFTQEGTLLPNFRAIRGPLRVTNAASATPVCTDVDVNDQITIRDGAIVEGNGAAPLWRLQTAGGIGGKPQVILDQSWLMLGPALGAVSPIELDAATTQALDLILLDRATSIDGVAGPGTEVLNVYYFGAATTFTNTLFLGTINRSGGDLHTGVGDTLYLDDDLDTYIRATADDTISWFVGGVSRLTLNSGGWTFAGGVSCGGYVTIGFVIAFTAESAATATGQWNVADQNTNIPVDTSGSGAAITRTLPNETNPSVRIITDIGDNCGTHNCIVVPDTGNGQSFAGGFSTVTIDRDGGALTLLFHTSSKKWSIIGGWGFTAA